jgi:hypothetical protein
MGYTHCFRANAAYSLYGVLKGNNDNGCTSGTYINSFFTNYGVDAFEPVMEAAGVFSEGNGDSYTAECQEGGNNDAGNDADGGGYGGGTSYANKGDNMGSTSYGMSCNSNQFVTKKFRGRYCDGKDAMEVTNLLESFNEAIEQVECVQVYSGSNDANNGDDDIASELLTSSKACSLREYPSQCPDPYGKLLRYTRALECSTGTICILTRPDARLSRDISSVVLLVSGLGMIGAALFCKWHRKKGKGQMDLIRESSELSHLSKAYTLSEVSSTISQASSKAVNAIQGFAEAAAPVGRTVQITLSKVFSTTSEASSKVVNAIQGVAEDLADPGRSTRTGLVFSSPSDVESVAIQGFAEAAAPVGRTVQTTPSKVFSTTSEASSKVVNAIQGIAEELADPRGTTRTGLVSSSPSDVESVASDVTKPGWAWFPLRRKATTKTKPRPKLKVVHCVD